MFSKTLLLAAFSALAALATAASPPGCLLGAVNSYENPVDIAAVCKDKDATSKIAGFCGDATKTALSAFAEICEAKGVKVSTDLPTSTMSVRPSGTSGATYGNGTSSGVAGPTGTGSPAGGNGAGPSSTQSGGPVQSTGAAGRLEVGAALLAGLGVMAAAL